MYLAATRYFLIGVLLVLNIAILVLSSSLFTVSNTNNVYRSIYVYLIFLSAFSCVFLIPIALIDFFRRGAVPSRVLFELGWLILFWVMHLAGASAITAASACTANDSCESVQHTLLVFTWLAVSVLLIHLATLLVITLLHVNDLPEVWTMGVRDVPWFHTRQQDKPPIPGAPTGAQPPASAQPRSSGPTPWHGYRRSHASRSWRDRYSSQSFQGGPSQDQENLPGANAPVDAARAFYPFLGQGASFPAVQEGDQDDAMLEPMPVSFTLERIQPPAQSRTAAEPSRTRSRGNSAAGNGGNNPFYNPALYDSQDRRQPLEQRQGGSSRQAPQPPAPSAPPRRSRSRVEAAYSATASESRRRDRSSRTAGPQLVPLELASSPPHRQQQQSMPSSASFPSSSAPPQPRQQQPPSDSLLFSTPASQQQQQQQSSRPSRGPPPSSTRLLPDTSAFYGTHIQSVLRERESDSETVADDADGRSTRSRMIYASTPKPKALSAAQAYAAEAQRQAINNNMGGSGRR